MLLSSLSTLGLWRLRGSHSGRFARLVLIGASKRFRTSNMATPLADGTAHRSRSSSTTCALALQSTAAINTVYVGRNSRGFHSYSLYTLRGQDRVEVIAGLLCGPNPIDLPDDRFRAAVSRIDPKAPADQVLDRVIICADIKGNH
jgi:hypothetical protein